MSALARYFLSQKWDVAGSDIAESPITAALRKEGITIKIGQKKDNVAADRALVIYSQAILPDNPELKEARRRAQPGRSLSVLSYPEAVGELTREHETIAIAGAHGKSTTTALTALVLEKGGFDPTVIVGANIKEYGGRNFRAGQSEYLVLEADEFGRAFLHYSPASAIITNIDREHLDIYKDLADIKKTFLLFLANMRDGGILIINRDNKNCFSLKTKIAALAGRKKLRVVWYSLRDPAAKKVRAAIIISGRHNLSNALAAYYMGRALGLAEKNVLAALHGYHGAERRMEYRGVLKIGNGKNKMNLSVYDDYAHHPAEIAAALQGFREKFSKANIVCVFQPHQARRLTALFKEFQSAFDDADGVVMLPIYKVAGRDEASSLDSAALVRAMQKRQPGKSITYLGDPAKLKTALNALISLSDAGRSKIKTGGLKTVLVMMGAGTIVHYTDTLLKADDRRKTGR